MPRSTLLKNRLSPTALRRWGRSALDAQLRADSEERERREELLRVARRAKCGTCKGRGRVFVKDDVAPGFHATPTFAPVRCPTCGGLG